MLSRTVVECTRDALADLIGADVASVAAKSGSASSSTVLDPFAGSGNTLYWLSQHIDPQATVGYELDDRVFETTQRNFSIVGIDAVLLHGPYEYGLRRTNVAADELLILFIAPPWGDALRASLGLDLERTKPPVAEIIDVVAETYPQNKLVVAVQLYETVVPASLQDVASRFDWSLRRTYDIDPPGRNHGLLLGSLGWAP